MPLSQREWEAQTMTLLRDWMGALPPKIVYESFLYFALYEMGFIIELAEYFVVPVLRCAVQED